MAVKLEPLGDRVVVRLLKKDEITKGGILIPDTAREKPQEGEVAAAGPGKLDDKGRRMPLDVKAGDKVLFAKYAGTEYKADEDEFTILREGDILARIV